MATLTIYSSNPGKKVEVEVSDEMLMGLFTNAAAAREGIFNLNSRIDQLWRTVLALAVVNTTIIGTVLGAILI